MAWHVTQWHGKILTWKFPNLCQKGHGSNPRRTGGWGVWTPPSQVFRRYLKNGGAPRCRFWRTYLYIFFRTCCENSRPRSFKVKSPGHVKWPHLIKSLNARHSSTEWPMITSKLSAIYIRNGAICEKYISEFWYRWPKVRSICDLSLHCKSMGGKWKAPLLDESHSKHYQTSSYR